MPDDSDYDLGYGKPPKGSRFQKGRSGNPTGRPRGSLNLSTVLQRTARERVVVTENGRRRELTKLELAAKQLANKASSGDLKAIGLFAQLMRYAEERSAGQPGEPEGVPLDSDLLACLLKRFSPTPGGEQT